MSLILKTFPVHLTQKVALDTDIEVTFIFDINKDTITTSNIILFNLAEQKSEPISLDYRNRVLRITPARKLQPLVHYQVELVGGINNGGIRDITGRGLNQNFRFEFHTGNETKITAPQLIAPTDVSEIHNDVVFRWNPVDKADYYELQISRSNTFDVLEWPKEQTLVFETQVIPDIVYKKGMTYYARLRAVNNQGVTSAFTPAIRYYYNGIDETMVEEKTEAISISGPSLPQVKDGESSSSSEIQALRDHFTAQLDGEINALQVTSMSPKNGSVMVVNASKIVIEFSEMIDPASINHETVYVVSEKN